MGCAVAGPGSGLPQRHHQHADHDGREQPAEPQQVHADRCDRPQHRSRQGAQAERQAEREIAILAAKLADRGDVLGEQGDPVGAVGCRRRHAHEDHGGQGEEGAAAGHHVGEPGDDPDRNQHHVLPDLQTASPTNALAGSANDFNPARSVVLIAATSVRRTHPGILANHQDLRKALSFGVDLATDTTCGNVYVASIPIDQSGE